MNKLTVVLATYNEEENIAGCLEAVKEIASEIVIVDGGSTDGTVEIAKKYSAKILITDNPPIFHINKQKALNMASNRWILQLDADEIVSFQLAEEIKKVINFSDKELESHQQNLLNKKLFLRHQELLNKRESKTGKLLGKIVAFYIPRLNYFLGKYLRYGGVYPDGVIRLVQKNQAFFPCRSVHEQISVDGRVGWLDNPLLHKDSPTFSRYLKRNNRYTTLLAQEIKSNQKNILTPVNYLFILPVRWFFMTFFRHKGFLDGWPGFVFSFFSSLRFPIAYIKHFSES